MGDLVVCHACARDRTCWDDIALAPLCRLLLRQLLLERDDFLQGVGVVPLSPLQFSFEIRIARFEPRNILIPHLQFH